MSYEAAPPEGEEKKRNTRLIIIIVVAVLLLCCCCTFLALGWFYGDRVVEMLGGLGAAPRLARLIL